LIRASQFCDKNLTKMDSGCQNVDLRPLQNIPFCPIFLSLTGGIYQQAQFLILKISNVFIWLKRNVTLRKALGERFNGLGDVVTKGGDQPAVCSDKC
jgi:hypothetical protein